MADTKSLPKTHTRVLVTKADRSPENASANVSVEGSAPLPTLASGQVLVKVLCRPVNPADIFSLQGVYPGFAPKTYPAVPGLEGCGVVVDSGDTKLAVGTRGVVFFNAKEGNGSWQEYAAVPAANVMQVPDKVSDEAASQFLVNPVTAFGMLDLIAAPAGEYVLQSAGGSTLGKLLIALAKKRGTKTISVVRRKEQVAELKALGADEVILESEDVPARVMEITGGKGAWGATDCVAAEMTGKLCAALRPKGHLHLYGAMQGFTFTVGVPDVLFRGIVIEGFWLNVWVGSLTPERKQQVFAEIVSFMADGSLTPHTGTAFALKDVAAAVDEAQKPARGGKVVLVSK